jgi:hypothetical protein
MQTDDVSRKYVDEEAEEKLIFIVSHGRMEKERRKEGCQAYLIERFHGIIGRKFAPLLIKMKKSDFRRPGLHIRSKVKISIQR